MKKKNNSFKKDFQKAGLTVELLKRAQKALLNDIPAILPDLDKVRRETIEWEKKYYLVPRD